MDLTELFDKHYPYTKGKNQNAMHHYHFNTKDKDGNDGETMHVKIMHHLHDEHSAHVAFVDSKGNHKNNDLHSHDAHKVLGTVKKILKDHAVKHDLHSYTFDADKSKAKGSRADVYTRMARGHKVTTSDGYGHDTNTKHIEVSTKKVNEENKMKNTYGLSKSLLEAVAAVGGQVNATESEQIDEISRKTALSYQKKSEAEQRKIGDKHDDNVLKILDSEDKRKFINRRNGSSEAWAKTTSHKFKNNGGPKIRATSVEQDKARKKLAEETVVSRLKAILKNNK